MRSKVTPVVRRYVIGLVSFAIPLLIAIVFQHLSVKLDLSLLIVAALIVATWYGGRGPGFMVAILMLAAALAFRTQPIPIPKLILLVANQMAVLSVLVLLVSTRKRAEIRLKEQSEWLMITLSSIADAVIATDMMGDITFMNPAAEWLIGVSISAATGKPLSKIFTIERETDGAEPDGLMAQEGCQSAARRLADEAILISSAETKVPIEFTTGPMRDHTGKTTGTVVVFRDVTQRKADHDRINRLNQELERRVAERTAELEGANQQLESFSYSVSHDLRAPLRSMDGFSRILLDEYGSQLGSEPRRLLEIIKDNASQMGCLIDDLLAFSRISRRPIQKRLTPLSGIVRQSIEKLEGEFQDRAVNIKVGDLPSREVDPALITQVFINLLSNALKYTRTKDRAAIEVGCEDKGGDGREGLVFYVKDNGVGFDMRYSHKLFEVFQRLHRQEDYEGTGVGLAIVQRVIQRHGGEIWAEAEVNKGAAFYFTLGEGGAGAPDISVTATEPVSAAHTSGIGYRETAGLDLSQDGVGLLK